MNKKLKILLIILAVLFFVAEQLWTFYLIGDGNVKREYYKTQMIGFCEMSNNLIDLTNDQSEIINTNILLEGGGLENLENLDCFYFLVD